MPLALGYLGHHHEQVGDHAVGGPQLDAVQHIVIAIRCGGGVQPGRVAAHIRLVSRKALISWVHRGSHVRFVFGADILIGCGTPIDSARKATRPRTDVRADERQGLVVVDLRQPDPAVLGGDLHAERAEFLQAADALIWDLRVAFDHGGIDLRLAEVTQSVEERPPRFAASAEPLGCG